MCLIICVWYALFNYNNGVSNVILFGNHFVNNMYVRK